ncbi:unnamed protein product, partial [Mesorhabditis spiculigera]
MARSQGSVDSVGLPNDQRVISYACTVLWYIAAFGIQIMAYGNNAWITVKSESSNEEFQRGLFDDCYFKDGVATSCKGWSSSYEQPAFGNGSIFSGSTIVEPCIVSKLMGWTARALLFLCIVWFFISIAFCYKLCLYKESRLVKIFWLAILVLYAVLFGLYLLARFNPGFVKPLPAGFKYSTGYPPGLFFIGLLCYLIATAFFFGEKTKTIPAHLINRWRNRAHHAPVPTNPPGPLSESHELRYNTPR